MLCGIANVSVVRLSPMIPPNSSIVEVAGAVPGMDVMWGERVYLGFAECCVTNPGEQAWAGIGWVQDERSGKGLIVQHEAHDETELRELIRTSLHELQASRGVELGPVREHVIGGTCRADSLCALAVAVFGSQAWSDVVALDAGTIPRGSRTISSPGAMRPGSSTVA